MDISTGALFFLFLLSEMAMLLYARIASRVGNVVALMADVMPRVALGDLCDLRVYHVDMAPDRCQRLFHLLPLVGGLLLAHGSLGQPSGDLLDQWLQVDLLEEDLPGPPKGSDLRGPSSR